MKPYIGVTGVMTPQESGLMDKCDAVCAVSWRNINIKCESKV